jgi:hypothetical protein
MQIKENWKKELRNENTLKFASWDKVLKFIKDNKNEIQSCIYRGQKNSSWQLEPSFFRKIPQNYKWEMLQRLAFAHLENFKKFTRGRHKISYTDPNDCDENWWALGQHYGLATPLLDWVRTPYVAAFFAFIEEISMRIKPPRAIFILDIERIRIILNDYRGEPPIHPRLEVVDPLTHENTRLVSQQGIFTYINHYGYRTIESYLNEINDKCKERLMRHCSIIEGVISSNDLENNLSKQRIIVASVLSPRL